MSVFKFVFFFGVFLCSFINHGKTDEVSPEPNIFCFYRNFAFINKGHEFGPTELVPALDKCTHLVYESSKLSNDYEIEPSDPQIDIIENLYSKITDLKKSFPKLKILLTLGDFRSLIERQRYFDVLHEESRRQKLVSSAQTILKKYGFDGVNLFWPISGNKHAPYTKEPVNIEDIEENKTDLGKLVQEFKEAFTPEQLLITVTLSDHGEVSVFYDIPTLNKYADMLIVVSPEFSKPSDQYDFSDPNFPIYYKPADKQQAQNTETKLKYLIEKQVDPKKIVLTLSTFGTWSLINKTAVETPGAKDLVSYIGGTSPFYEVCQQVGSSKKHGNYNEFTETISHFVGDRFANVVEKKLKEPYAIWFTYEYPESFALKTSVVKSLGLAGIALSEISFDDGTGACGEKFPLLNSIVKQWNL